MKLLLGFDYLITPRVLVFLYWLIMLLILVSGVFYMIQVNFLIGLFGIIFGLIYCRMVFELIMVAFKNNEYLRQIADNTSKTRTIVE